MHIWNFLFCNFFHSLPQSPPADNPSSNKAMLSLLNDSTNSCHSAEWVPKTGPLPLHPLFSHHPLKKHYAFQRMSLNIKKGYSLAENFTIHFSIPWIKIYSFPYLFYWINIFKLFQWILCPRVLLPNNSFMQQNSLKDRKNTLSLQLVYTRHIFQLNSLWSDNAMLHFEASSTTTTQKVLPSVTLRLYFSNINSQLSF